MMNETNDIPWTESAVCRSVDPEIFFPDGKDAHKYVKQAKKVCASCPVKMECAVEALTTGIQYGVWAGEYFGTRYEQKARSVRALEHLTGLTYSGPLNAIGRLERNNRIDKAHELTKQGFSANEIAEQIGLGPRQIVRYRGSMAVESA